MDKLKASEVAAFRLQVLAAQGGLCALTGKPVDPKDAVLDHDHKTGECRGVLSRGANTMLGKIENHRRIAGFSKDADLARMLAGVVQYICTARLGVRYPTHRTPAEARLRRNKKARARRAAAKEA